MAAVTVAATAKEDTAVATMDMDTIITVVVGTEVTAAATTTVDTMDTAMAVVITTVATVAGAVAHAVKEVQATVASKGVVVRARGTNPINKGTLLIYDRDANRIVTAGNASRGFRLQSQYYNSSNHSIQYTSTSAFRDTGLE
ncbi:hypothetical protein DBV15_07328 [Temnothorax longispinosus]|uniref:Uncharacterized protein n=1 Tax=Temnothorax longispinosus TaxID=300112 RepID=A0A4S2KNM5_9HYME|nr:hypothetical protein DBV15_07328 [Temnothorax longispinosus]